MNLSIALGFRFQASFVEGWCTRDLSSSLRYHCISSQRYPGRPGVGRIMTEMDIRYARWQRQLNWNLQSMPNVGKGLGKYRVTTKD